MADEMVLRAQRFINSYNVAGIPKVEEDGRTGWPVMRALTRALQHEIGITALSDSFGPGTLSRLESVHPEVATATSQAAVVRILQSGLYCKGYDGGGIDGVFNSRTSDSCIRLKQNMGVASAYPGEGVTPKVFKALLNMDAYTRIGDGTDNVRQVQQWLNGSYVSRRNYFIVPCDGFFSRDVQKALIYAIQYAIGMSDDVANGSLGPGTRDGIRRNEVGPGSAGTFVQLFAASMIVNKRDGVAFQSSFDANLSSRARAFQAFVMLPGTGRGDFQTWMSLLVSTGDSTRPGTACDTITAITALRAQALTSAGYTVVGRYLSNAPTAGSLNKQLQPGELAALAAGGMRVFPIYQTFGNSVERFSRSSGTADALHAIARARYHGFRPGTRIYFAVDFDALDYQVTENILPHFRAVHATLREYGPEYEIGIYAPRNVCSRISAEGLSTASFVCGMSTAFSGNLGYPLPEDWAFDQIATKYVGTGSSGIAIDNNIASGRDAGQNQFNASVGGNELDVEFDSTLRDGLLADLRAYLESVETPETGGPERFEFTTRSNGTSFEIVMALDGVITGLARTLRVRKALIQAPLLWEVRKYNPEDIAADEQVISYHEGRLVPPAFGRRDSSTGLGQIVGATAIAARNFCISENIISGTAADSAVDAELYAVWRRLRDDNVYNVSTLPLVLIHAARLINARRPAPDYTEDETRQAMARYNGTGDAAQNYGQVTLGLYRVFEAYNAPLR